MLGVNDQAEITERIDNIEIVKDAQLAEAISSLKFYFNLARKEGRTLYYELWQKRDKPVVPGRETTPSPGLVLRKRMPP